MGTEDNPIKATGEVHLLGGDGEHYPIIGYLDEGLTSTNPDDSIWNSDQRTIATADEITFTVTVDDMSDETLALFYGRHPHDGKYPPLSCDGSCGICLTDEQRDAIGRAVDERLIDDLDRTLADGPTSAEAFREATQPRLDQFAAAQEKIREALAPMMENFFTRQREEYDRIRNLFLPSEYTPPTPGNTVTVYVNQPEEYSMTEDITHAEKITRAEDTLAEAQDHFQHAVENLLEAQNHFNDLAGEQTPIEIVMEGVDALRKRVDAVEKRLDQLEDDTVVNDHDHVHWAPAAGVIDALATINEKNNKILGALPDAATCITGGITPYRLAGFNITEADLAPEPVEFDRHWINKIITAHVADALANADNARPITRVTIEVLNGDGHDYTDINLGVNFVNGDIVILEDTGALIADIDAGEWDHIAIYCDRDGKRDEINVEITTHHDPITFRNIRRRIFVDNTGTLTIRKRDGSTIRLEDGSWTGFKFV